MYGKSEKYLWFKQLQRQYSSYIIAITISLWEDTPDSNLNMCICVCLCREDHAVRAVEALKHSEAFKAGLPRSLSAAGIVPRSWMKRCLSLEALHGVHHPMTAELVYLNQ